jgi:hypothetical protein
VSVTWPSGKTEHMAAEFDYAWLEKRALAQILHGDTYATAARQIGKKLSYSFSQTGRVR